MNLLYEYRAKIVKRFLKELSIKTERSEEDIEKNGLYFTDFNKTVDFELDDKTKMHIPRAFYVQNEEEICVFTEHYGYISFDKEAVIKLQEK